MTQLSHPLVSLVILSHNRMDELSRSLDDYCADNGTRDYELIVVDNASTDGSRNVIAKYQAKHPKIVSVLQDANLGVAGGRNAGYAQALGEFILSLDEDAHIRPHDIAALAALLKKLPGVAILSPKIVHDATGEAQNHHGGQPCIVGNFHGACYLFRRSLLDEIGYLDGLCHFGGEELEYSIRARAAGYGVLYIPDIEVRHNNFIRPGRVGDDRLKKWLYNFVRIYYKFFPVFMATLFSMRYFSSYLLHCFASRSLLVVPQLVWAVGRAILDGLGSRTPVAKEVADFYANPSLRPDVGNVPVWLKIANKFRTPTGVE